MQTLLGMHSIRSVSSRRCSCKGLGVPLNHGHHFISCSWGGNQTAAHDIVKKTVKEIARSAGIFVEDLDVNNDGRRADLRLHNLGENGEAVAVDIVVPDPFAVSRIDRCLRETGHHLFVAGQGKVRKHGHLFQWQRIVRGSYDNPLGKKDLFFPWEMDHFGLTGYGAQTVLKMIADFAVKNNTFSRGQKSVHVNRWRQRLSCELAEVVGTSARALLLRDDSCGWRWIAPQSEFERADLF